MEKEFNLVSVGEKFSVNGIEYVKIQEVRISCCKSVNAQASTNSSQRTFFPGNTIVTINNG
jgi:hypothetical protein